MYLNISIKNIIKSKWFLIAVAILAVTVFTVLNYKIELISFGKKISKNKKVIGLGPYYAEYDLTVVSNKNVNTYSVKERYKDNSHSFSYLDSVGNIFTIDIEETKVTIQNSNEKNIFDVAMPKLEESRLCFSSLMKLYENITGGKSSCNCKVNMYEKDNNINIHFISCGKSVDNSCINSFLQTDEIYGVVIALDKGGTPSTITITDKNQNVLNCIVYTKFEKEF